MNCVGKSELLMRGLVHMGGLRHDTFSLSLLMSRAWLPFCLELRKAYWPSSIMPSCPCPRTLRISSHFCACGLGPGGQDGEGAMLWREGRNRNVEESDISSLYIPASLSSLPRHRGIHAHTRMYILSLLSEQMQSALESPRLNEETAIPVSSSYPLPGLMLCLAVVAGLRGNTLCSPWWFFFLRWRPKIILLYNWLFNQPCK